MDTIKLHDEVKVNLQNALEGATGTVVRIYREAIGTNGGLKGIYFREWAIVRLPGFVGDRHIPTAGLDLVGVSA
jgi:hypothetical protein